MEIGRYIQLLSLIGFPQTKPEDIRVWIDANPSLIGRYTGEVTATWALDKLADALQYDQNWEEVVEAVTMFAPMDQSNSIPASKICTRLGDLLKTADPNIKKHILGCFLAIVQRDESRAAVAAAAGLTIYSLKRSEVSEVAEIADQITHILLSNRDAFDYISHALAGARRSDGDEGKIRASLGRRSQGGRVSADGLFGKSKDTQLSSSPNAPNRRESFHKKIVEETTNSSSTTDGSRRISLSSRAFSTSQGNLEYVPPPSQQSEAPYVFAADGSYERRAGAEIWWREIEPGKPQACIDKARQKSVGLACLRREPGGAIVHVIAKEILELLILWRRHRRILRGIYNEFMYVQRQAVDEAIESEYQTFATLAIMELDAEKRRWQKSYPKYERAYGTSVVSHMEFALNLGLELLHSEDERIVVVLVEILADFIAEDLTVCQHISNQDGVEDFRRLIDSPNPKIINYALRAILNLSTFSHQNRKLLGKVHAIPRLSILASSDSAETRKLSAKILVSLSEERKLKDKVFKDPNLPSYMTLTKSFSDFERDHASTAPATQQSHDQASEAGRDIEFRKRFNLPDSEKILKSYSCALLRQIPAHGRLWVSNHYLCFYCGIYGLKTMEVIPITHIKDVNKSHHKYINPAIDIVTETRTFKFLSFFDRDRAFKYISRAALEAAEAPEDEEEDIPEFLGAEEIKFVDLFQNQMLPVDVSKYFQLIHSNESPFAKEYHANRGDQDLIVGLWGPHPSFGQVRELKYTVNTNAPIGPKTAPVVETQRYYIKEPNLHVWESVCETKDVPYGDCFLIETRITAQSNGQNVTRVDGITAVNFVKSCFVQGTIEKTTIRQGKESYIEWAKLAEDYAKFPDRSDPKLQERKKASSDGETGTLNSSKGGPTPSKHNADLSGTLQNLQYLMAFISVLVVCSFIMLWLILSRLATIEARFSSSS